MAGAEYLQSIFGTEKDKVNCPFYFKIGACRHGDKCERRHNKPTLSQTLIIVNMYQNPATNPNYVEDKNAQEIFEDFYEDIYDELATYGEIEELNVCENICDHMIGNVYVKYFKEEDAEKALRGLTGRFYGGKPIVAEFSPVTDFREASCRQYEMHECLRGGHCNFMHLKQISRSLYRELFARRKRHKSRSRSHSPHSHKGSSSSSSKKRSRSRSPKKSKSSSSRRERSRSRDRDDRHKKERDHNGRDSKESSERHHSTEPDSHQEESFEQQ